MKSVVVVVASLVAVAVALAVAVAVARVRVRAGPMTSPERRPVPNWLLHFQYGNELSPYLR